MNENDFGFPALSPTECAAVLLKQLKMQIHFMRQPGAWLHNTVNTAAPPLAEQCVTCIEELLAENERLRNPK